MKIFVTGLVKTLYLEKTIQLYNCIFQQTLFDIKALKYYIKKVQEYYHIPNQTNKMSLMQLFNRFSKISYTYFTFMSKTFGSFVDIEILGLKINFC